MAESILEVCKVSPSQGSPTDICLPLTFFDLFLLKAHSPEILFFYQVPLTESVFSRSVVPKLKHNLSQTLQYFLPLAGHLTWTSSFSSPVIRYQEGDGVLLTVAVSDADFHHLSGKNIRECSIFRPLVASLVGSDSQVSVLALKVTLFPNKGFCICITVHHGVFDGKSVALFMNLWASISKSGEIKGLGSELTPVLERKNVRERYAEIERSYVELLKKNGVGHNSLAVEKFDPPADKVRGTFELSRLEIKKLKELIRDQVSYVSTLIITYAYVILCMVNTKGLVSNRICVFIPVDIRGRLEPPLPANYFGNCLGYFKVILNKEELLRRDGMAVIVNNIYKIMKGVNENYDDGVLKWMSNADDTGATMVSVSGSSRFGYHKIDFGWGRPKKADNRLTDTNSSMRIITITEVEDGIIEVELSLNKHEMECFSCEFAQGLEKMTKRGFSSL